MSPIDPATAADRRRAREYVATHEASGYEVTCPRCGALPAVGDMPANKCKDRSGNAKRQPHSARIRAARARATT